MKEALLVKGLTSYSLSLILLFSKANNKITPAWIKLNEIDPYNPIIFC